MKGNAFEETDLCWILCDNWLWKHSLLFSFDFSSHFSDLSEFLCAVNFIVFDFPIFSVLALTLYSQFMPSFIPNAAVFDSFRKNRNDGSSGTPH